MKFQFQFAFRPTGSTTAAIVHLLDSIINLLETEPYVIVISLDFKAALLNPPPLLSFSDQFAFRPSGSTTAALITILHTITRLLTTNQFVIVIALDFSKAFDIDTVRHLTLLNKFSQMHIPDHLI